MTHQESNPQPWACSVVTQPTTPRRVPHNMTRNRTKILTVFLTLSIIRQKPISEILKYEKEMYLIIEEMGQHCVRGRTVQCSEFLTQASHFIIPLTVRSHVHGFL